MTAMDEQIETKQPEATPASRPPAWDKSYRSVDPRTKSAFLAAFLSIVPGLGQIYVGYYQRGFINPVVIGSVIGLLVVTSSQDEPPFYLPLAIIFMIFFWLYNIIDAWRRATMYNLALEGVESIQLPDDMGGPSLGGSMFGGATLLAVGFVILLHTKFGLPLEVLHEWWPVLPMAFGGYLLYRGWLDKQNKA